MDWLAFSDSMALVSFPESSVEGAKNETSVNENAHSYTKWTSVYLGVCVYIYIYICMVYRIPNISIHNILCIIYMYILFPMQDAANTGGRQSQIDWESANMMLAIARDMGPSNREHVEG